MSTIQVYTIWDENICEGVSLQNVKTFLREIERIYNQRKKENTITHTHPHKQQLYYTTRDEKRETET